MPWSPIPVLGQSPKLRRPAAGLSANVRSFRAGKSLSHAPLHTRIATAPVVHDRERARRVHGRPCAALRGGGGAGPARRAPAPAARPRPARRHFRRLALSDRAHRARSGGSAARARHRARGALRRALQRCRPRRRCGGCLSRRHAPPAPVQERRRPPDGALRSRRRMAGHDGDAPAVRGGRHSRWHGRAVSLPPGRQAGRLARRGARRLHRAGHGQVRRLRAQLLLRHRPDRFLRSRPHPPQARRRGAALLRAADARSRAPAERAHRARLCVPHRPAAAARSRLHPARHLDRGRPQLLRELRAELGARRAHQGAARGGRHRRRRRPCCASWSPTSGASISISRPSPTFTP